MLGAILGLVGCELAGELIRAATRLPIPGPVIGMFLLAAFLAVRIGKNSGSVPAALDRTASILIDLLGLLFVPAGVGIIAEAGLLRQQWLPILAALLGSTVLSIAVTGLVMHRAMRASRAARTRAGPGSGVAGLRYD